MRLRDGFAFLLGNVACYICFVLQEMYMTCEV